MWLVDQSCTDNGDGASLVDLVGEFGLREVLVEDAEIGFFV